MESLEILLKNQNRRMPYEEKQRLTEIKNNYYREYLQQMSTEDIKSDVRNTLRVLRERKIKLAIGSSSKNAKLILKKTKMTQWFDVICDGNDISKSKPDPEVFVKAAEALQMPRADCLVVEDADAGVLAAHGGGFACAGIGEAAKRRDVEFPLKKLSDLLELR